MADSSPEPGLAHLHAELRADLAGHRDSDRDGDRGGGPGLSQLCRRLTVELDLMTAEIAVIGGDGIPGTIGSAGAGGSAVGDVQLDVGEGPTQEAVESGRAVLVADLRSGSDRWPGFAAQALSLGVRSVYAFPLQLGGARLGALTCYCARPGPLDRDQLAMCSIYAEVAVEHLLQGRSDGAPGGPVGGGLLGADVHIRSEIFQAQGMVMVDLGVDLIEALARLRASAFAAGLSLGEYAVGVIDGTRTVTPDAHRTTSDGTVDHDHDDDHDRGPAGPHPEPDDPDA